MIWNIISLWLTTNVMILLVIIYQRSSSLRHRIHRLVFSCLVVEARSRHRLQFARVLVDASHFNR
jgi:hypothetical protein